MNVRPCEDVELDTMSKYGSWGVCGTILKNRPPRLIKMEMQRCNFAVEKLQMRCSSKQEKVNDDRYTSMTQI